jgi:predicted nucleotide-binding protein
MRVAVLGSWRQQDAAEWELSETQDAFAKACRRIGRELIERGHSLIVGTEALHTADGNAALGAYEAIGQSAEPRPRIMVVRLDDAKGGRPFDRQRRERPGIFIDRPVDAATMAVVKLVQTQLADAVVLIGGAEKTEQAALIAAVGKKPLACIGSFGGAAARLNKRFQGSPNAWGYESSEVEPLAMLQEPFSDAVLNAALEIAWIQGAPKLMVIHGRSTHRDVLKEYLKSRVGRVIVLADELDNTELITAKFERLAATVDGAVALLTPDDTGSLALDPASAAPRARENVWIEVGWFWGRRGRSKLLLLKQGEVTIPSDLRGVEDYQYSASPIERSSVIEAFIARLRAASDR